MTAPTGTRNDGEALDAAYPVGTTTITWTVTDNNGNEAVSVEQTVTITDDELPTISCGGTISQPADAGEDFATVTVTAPVTGDNCEVASVVNNYNNTADASDSYPLGTTVVVWTVTDIHGNQSTCEQTITVTDEEAPQITCAAPLNQTADADVCEAYVTVTAPAVVDNDGIQSLVNDYNGTDDASGVYPVGTTVVTWTATDNNGNTSQCTQEITVTDDQGPLAPTLADVTGECEATVVAPTTSDNCAGTITATTDAPLTYTEQGEYVVTWTFNDGNGNITTVDQNVIVKDVTAPAAITLADVTGECEATVVAPTTSDNCAGTITATTNDPLDL